MATIHKTGQLEKHVLDNGLSVFYYPIPTSYSVAIGLYINTDRHQETEQNAGITHLLEHMHFRQLAGMGQRDIYHYMEQRGSSLRASTSHQQLRFQAICRPYHLHNCLVPFQHIFLTDQWSPEQVEAERLIVLNELYEEGESKSFSAYCDELAYRKTALHYSVLGTESSIKAITPEALSAHKEAIFRRGNLAFVLTGNFSAADMASIDHAFGQLPLRPPTPGEELSMPFLGRRKPDIKLINWGGKQLHVNINFDIDLRTLACSQDELHLFSDLISNGDGSKLPLVIREQLGLTYSISSQVLYRREFAMLDLDYQVNREQFYFCLEKIVQELNQAKQQITSYDLSLNMPFYTENQWFSLEDPAWLNERIATNIFVNNQPAWDIESKIASCQAITKERLMELARQIFCPRNISITVAGSTYKLRHKEIRAILQQLDQQ